MNVNILGTEYTVKKKKLKEEQAFEVRKIDGYCDRYQHIIVYCDLDSDERWDLEPNKTKRECEKQTIRHEITHAFLFESGLAESTHGMDHGWAVDEEVVDWIADQSPKIYAAFVEAGAI